MKALLIVAGLFFSIFGAVIAYFAASDPGQEYELKFVLPIDVRQMPKPVAPPSVQSWSAGQEESGCHRWTRRGWESAGHARQTSYRIWRAVRRRIRVPAEEIAEQAAVSLTLDLPGSGHPAALLSMLHIGLAMPLIRPHHVSLLPLRRHHALERGGPHLDWPAFQRSYRRSTNSHGKCHRRN